MPRMTDHSPTLREGERVANRVRGLMAERRVSQLVMAERLGLSRAAMGRRLTGEIALDVDELAAAARVLGVPLTRLVEAEAEVVR